MKLSHWWMRSHMSLDEAVSLVDEKSHDVA